MQGDSLITVGFIAQNRVLSIHTRGRISMGHSIAVCISHPRAPAEHYPNYKLSAEVITE